MTLVASIFVSFYLSVFTALATVPVMETPPIPEVRGAVVSNPVNAYRITLGLSPLPESPETCAYAEKRLADLPAEFSHRVFLEEKTGHGYWVENLARNYYSEQSVVDAWKTSVTHDANLRADVSALCVRSSGSYWVLSGK